ncbi:MAG: hypothetical protein IJF59_01680 [Clostridia bacterium]|nr:hypothetical protein [Clostridia bacterium]MBQ3078108.1 hypothetical protein [Clostridia bacterium]
MNLKDAFRFQNKLQALMEEAQAILSDDANITRVESTHLRKKVMPEAENETITERPGTPYADHITDLARFLLWLLGERENLSAAIHKAKAALARPIDLDSEVGLNGKRQELARLFRSMAGRRSEELVIPGGGVGYRFNAEGNQVTYRCDIKRVTSINFDRDQVRKLAVSLSRRSDEVSSAIDWCLIETKVEYQPPFDVNDSFAEVFEAFAGIAR